MKKFIVLLSIFIVVACGALKFSDNYSWDTVLYHLFIMALILSCIYVINLAFTRLFRTSIPAFIVFHAFNYLFLVTIVVFYLLVLGSNFFWRKTITLNIIKNYFNSLGEFVDTIPVQKTIVLSVPAILMIIVTVLYFFAKPSYEKLRATALQQLQLPRTAILLGVTLCLFFLFRHTIIDFKRRMHFAEEPFLVFTLGSVWQGTGEKMPFDKVRYENGLKDRECIAAIHPQSNTPKQNFVVILIDGLRSDHLSFYGYQRKTTPFLDSLYKGGHLSFVKNAFSTSNNTIGGVAGLFYSKDWDKFGYDGLNIQKFSKKLGYRNYAFLTGFHKEWYGLSALYRSDCDFYYESSMSYDERYRVDDDLKTLDVIKRKKIDTPSFTYIHLLSVHHVGKKYDQFKHYLPDKIGLGTDKREALTNNYDNGILQADFVIREIFSKLMSDLVLPNATIFIVADHGELFGEDGKWSHGGDLHEKLLEVPILIYDGQRQLKNPEAGTLLDIGPTIADRLGYTVPSCWQGFSLFKHPTDFKINVYSNDDNIEFPNGTLEKKDSLFTFQILGKNNIPLLVKQKTTGIWQKKDNELSKKNN